MRIDDRPISGRREYSRAIELVAAVGNAVSGTELDVVRDSLKKIRSEADGGNIVFHNTNVLIWGKIRDKIRELDYLLADISNEEMRDILKRNQLCVHGRLAISHKDSIKSISDAQRRYLERIPAVRHHFELVARYRPIGKADIIVTSQTDRLLRGLSVKHGTGKAEVKLSQQSKRSIYYFKPKSVELCGGIRQERFEDLRRLLESIPESKRITQLSPDKILKIKGKRDEKFAYIKATFPDRWERRVNEICEESYQYIKRFSNSFAQKEHAGDNLRELIRKRLISELSPHEGVEAWISGMRNPINLTELLNDKRCFENVSNIEQEVRLSQSVWQKPSVLLWAWVDGIKYLVCKIQPSFDGAQPNVEQTKGIIYYFQEGRVCSEKTIWDLLEALQEKHKSG